MDVHTRKLRYFLAVAEELHFGRAADRFFVAQQAMSKQIRDLESGVGAVLFRRTTRKVELTAAGEALATATRRALSALDEGVRDSQRANRNEAGQLSVGFRLGAALELTGPILDAFRRRHPTIDMDLRELDFEDPWGGLYDGSVDVAFVRAPVDASSLHFEQLFTEPRVVAICIAHPLAEQDTVSVTEILHLPIVVSASTDDVWQSYWTLGEHRDAGTAAQIINSTSHTEEMELVSAGMACSVTVAAAARFTPHPGVAYRPIADVEPSSLGLAWRPDHFDASIGRFVATAIETRDREVEIVKRIERPFS